MIIGSHVSIKNGYLDAAKKAVANQASAFQYFPKYPRSLSIKDFDQEDAQNCKEFCLQHQIKSVAHTPYSTSLTPPENKKELTKKWGEEIKGTDKTSVPFSIIQRSQLLTVLRHLLN
jgi:deoxyribonuclease-4